ncbi:MAG: CPXCG motif-containing cysteine-rich protein [Myxococcota bacterium]|nr:CPXCG motif-containing cysteine-rich protein [Myxococcota bacterium]
MFEVSVQCPACFQWVEISVDPGDRGVFVQDCEVCCRPMEITLAWTENSEPRVRVQPAG